MISLQNITLQRGTQILFEKSDLTIHPGWHVGITGLNGCGKSSLFALLRGELSSDSGNVVIPAQWRIVSVSQETPDSTQTALDYVLDGDHQYRQIEQQIAQAEQNNEGTNIARLHGEFEAIDGYHAPVRAAKLLTGLGFSQHEHQQAVSSFSGGWRMRLNLAQALIQRSDLLLLDEPTNHLDLDTTFWLQDWLQSYPGTLLLISHDRDFLDVVVKQIIHIEQQRLNLYKGNYTQFELQRATRMEQQQSAFEKQQTQIKHLQQFINRFKAKATKAKQAQSRIKTLERMEQLLPAHFDSPFRFAFKEPHKLPNSLLSIEKGEVGYGDTPLLTQIELTLKPEDRIALIGHNGAGKTTLIKMLAAQLALMTGNREEAADLNIGYFAQHQMELLDGDATPLLHMSRLDPSASEQQLRDHLGGFNFQGDKTLGLVKTFSGGEKARLVLAMLIYQRPNLLLLDEPTNHLDLEMRHALTMALQDFKGAIVLISHDKHLLRSITDQYWMVDNGSITPFEGDLDDYHAWLLQSIKPDSDSIATQPGASQSKKEQRQQAANRRQQLKPLTSKLQKIEKDLEKLQGQQQLIEQKLAQADIYEDQNKSELTRLLQEKGQLDSQHETLEETWFEISEQLQQMEQLI